MIHQIAYIVFQEKRPFSYKDFLTFEVDGMHHGMSRETFRNKISKLIKKGEVKRLFNSGIGFYTLVGQDLPKPMTLDRIGIHNDPFYKLLQILPFGRRSIHDIRLKFKVPMIWKLLSTNHNFIVISRTKDIMVPAWKVNNAIIKIVVHKTDTVTVIIGCSLYPIPIDTGGIINFFTLLVRIEERFRSIIDNCHMVNFENGRILVPNYKTWIVTMWHFGRDSLTQYKGEKFHIAIEKAKDILIMYTKNTEKGKTRIRIESQEYPQKSLEDAIGEKLR